MTLATDGSTDGGRCPSASGVLECGGECVDVRVDPRHCGACNQPVCHFEICSQGQPACAAGFTKCPGAGGSCLGCTSTMDDPDHCGSCTKVCTGSQKCAGGNCVAACPAGLVECGRSCVADPNNSLAHCGCGPPDDMGNGGNTQPCGPDELCSKGNCEKYAGTPGCNQCPCGCTDPNPSCCSYAGTTVCTSADTCP